MASSRAQRSRTTYVPVCLALLLLVSLRPSSARLLRPTGNGDGAAIDVAREVKDAVVDKYAPLLLAMLPRAPVPPSGPSGGTNDAPRN